MLVYAMLYQIATLSIHVNSVLDLRRTVTNTVTNGRRLEEKEKGRLFGGLGGGSGDRVGGAVAAACRDRSAVDIARGEYGIASVNQVFGRRGFGQTEL